ncbi:gamma-glutamyl-gamma-aminobutyrate hydrolase family protein [Halomonas sp. ATCH28]|uniref:Gamma-glutamyl-gamma-aminobutyrate hydrolase family protein n=1 Tax=Halomonas gemina TaxID=2945105 RepID=A0ABT0T0V4_9GAMM|nr:gamma-glutamyl-gamma-aminobutyrate hydrolase family protein [Halomonas gemina]MCL7940402.1 gamma-glutamyl-gamma-aminobutyrate hydrolase family protein [Halomonas gemina]
MVIGLLQCDDVAPALRGRHGNYPEMFEALFHRVDPSLTFRVWRCLDGEIPDDVEAVDAWLTTGSKFGVNDDLPWIAELEAFVRALWAAGKPLVGICFGHQLMARALGGEVEKSGRGWGVGLSFNRVSERADWMVPWQPGLDLLVSHQDQVERLPEGARVLGGSDFCPAYLMQVGEHFLGVQGHPEFTRAYSRELMALRADLVGHHRVREGQASLSAPVDNTLMVRWILAFMRRAIQLRGSAAQSRP